MISQKIVSPKNIESELQQIWQTLAKEKKVRAGLFTLIVYAKLSDRLDSIRQVLSNLIEKFPCRILFLTYDPDAEKEYLKTAVSVIFPKNSEGVIACDSIDIGMAGKDSDKALFLILSHLLPDLPVYLFWWENFYENEHLFQKLVSLVNRVIVDSGSEESLFAFAKKTIENIQNNQIEFVDLNWVKVENWRDLFSSEFYSQDRLEKLKNAKSIEIVYQKQKDKPLLQTSLQALYFQAWIASCMNWKFVKYTQTEKGFEIQYENVAITLSTCSEDRSIQNGSIENGAISKVSLFTNENEQLIFSRSKSNQVDVEITSPVQCELPYCFVLKPLTIGSILAKEMTNKGISTHYLQTLENLTKLS